MTEKPIPHCGLCQVPVTDWKAHMEGKEHRANLEKAGEGEFGVASGMVANKILAKEVMDEMDKDFKKLKEGIEKRANETREPRL